MSEVKPTITRVILPRYEISNGEGVKGRQEPTMTLMSNDQVPDSNVYLEVGWIYEMPDPNPHINEHMHEKYDEIVLHIGGDPDNPEDLGAEIEFTIDNKPLLINKTSSVFIPAGVKHGPVVWKKVRKPHLQMAIVLGAGSMAEADPGGHENEKKNISK
jgi:hypothetical protein